MAVPQNWITEVLRGVGAPVTNANVKALQAWQRAEGGGTANTANFNPLNTTQPMPGAGSINSVGVRSYTSPRQGIAATVQTLKNGHYADIIRSLQRGVSAQEVAQAVAGSPWGTGQGVLRVLGAGFKMAALPKAGAGVYSGSVAVQPPVQGKLPPHTYLNFVRSMIAAHKNNSPEAYYGAVMQLRNDLKKRTTVAQPSSAASSPLAAQPSSGGMQPTFNKRLAELQKAVGNLSITSGYRSVAEQAKLYNAALQKYGSEAEARKHVAPPGQSNHNKGLAADLGGNLQLAHQLAPKYGLTFPMSWEPWHVELAGVR